TPHTPPYNVRDGLPRPKSHQTRRIEGQTVGEGLTGGTGRRGSPAPWSGYGWVYCPPTRVSTCRLLWMVVCVSPRDATRSWMSSTGECFSSNLDLLSDSLQVPVRQFSDNCHSALHLHRHS
ncbi:hypothetical protein CORC01_04273, partial [Colletotrichum orchidophilum]